MEAAVELPQYRSHKIVRAAKITGFRGNGIPDAPDLVLGDIGAVVASPIDWFNRHTPEVGGYYVVYDDGYTSFSPAKAFEEGYARVSDTGPQVGEQTVEGEIQAKGKTGPRVTPDDIEANIASEHYFTAAEGANFNDATPACDPPAGPLDLLTFCVLVLRNGTTVAGESFCAHPEYFDAEIGRRGAREAAKQKIWPMMVYELRTKLAAG